MASYDPYDSPTRERSHRYVEERRETRDPRYGDRESYLKVHSQSLVPRHREDSDLSVEEIRRDFPPLGYSRDIRRARSAEPGPGYHDYDPRDRGFEDHRPRGKKGASSSYYEEEEREKSRRRVLSKQEKIIAAVAGAALAIGGKEIFDRREAKDKHADVQRNYLQSAALGAAGALTVYGGTGLYNKQMAKDDKKSTYIVHRGRDGKITEYYSDDDDDAAAKKGHKSFLESALGVTSLGAAVKAFTGGGDEKEKHRGRGQHDRSRSSSRSRSGGGNMGSKIQKSAMAALIAGATEAFRVSKEPGSWKGEKSKRILTAALGAGAIDTAHDSEKHSKLGLAESVIGGLLSNRLVHGSKKNIEVDERTGRSRSRSRARSSSRGGGTSGLAALATAGLGALGAKKALEGRSSRSRSRSGRRHSADSEENGGRRRSRSRSVVDTARKSLAKLGIGSNPEDKERRRRNHDDYDESPRSSRRQHERRYSDEGYYEDDARGSVRSGRDYEEDRSYRPRRKGGKSDAGSESDLGDSSEDEKRAKKMRDGHRRHH